MKQQEEFEEELNKKLCCMKNVELDMTNYKLRVGIDYWANQFMSWGLYIND